MTAVSRGQVTIELQTRSTLTQQDGFIHAGAPFSVMDSACGLAATLPSSKSVLTARVQDQSLEASTWHESARSRQCPQDRSQTGREPGHMVNDIMVEDPEPCACMVGAISAVDWIPDLDAMSRSGRL